jgi:hypothetical protein
VFLFSHGYLYGFITTGLPIYGVKVLGLDAMKNGIQVSIPWLICWTTSILAGVSAISLTNADTIKKTTIRKWYAAIVLIGSPLMLMGAVVADCNRFIVKSFMKMSVVLLGFERSSLRINSLDLCPSKCYKAVIYCLSLTPSISQSVGNCIIRYNIDRVIYYLRKSFRSKLLFEKHLKITII